MKNRNGIIHLIAVVVLLLLVIIVVLGEKYSNEQKCAEPGCDKSVCYNSDYCYTHHKEHAAKDRQCSTTVSPKTTSKKKTTATAGDPDTYNAKGYDNFDDFYYDHYKDFLDYGDAKDYYYSNRY